MPGSHTQAREDQPEFVTSAEVMDRLRISRRTLERYIDRGLLPVLRLPSGHRRYRPEDVEALLTEASA